MSLNMDNLKGHGFHEISAEKQRKIAQKGGKASVKARNERKRLREELLDLLEASPELQAEMCVQLINKARKGNVQAFKAIRDTIGEAQPQTVKLDTPIATEEEAKQALIDLGLVDGKLLDE